MKIGDDVVYHTMNEDHLAEIIGFDKTSGMVKIKFVLKSLVPQTMYVRPDLLELVDWDLLNRESRNDYTPTKKALSCTCGAKFTSNPNYHLPGVCDLVEKK